VIQVSSSRFDSVQSVLGGLNAPLSEQSSKLINSTLNSHMEIFFIDLSDRRSHGHPFLDSAISRQ